MPARPHIARDHVKHRAMTLLIILACVRAVAYAQAPDRADGTDPVPDPGQVASPAQVTKTVHEAQDSPLTPEPAVSGEKKKEKRGSVVVAPLPTVSPVIGSGVIPVIGYIFPFSKNDKVSPPSTIGAAGMYTSNGTRGLAAGGQLFLKENTYEVTAGFGRGNINYSIYGPGILTGRPDLKLPLKQTGHVLMAEVLRRLKWGIFAGPRFLDGASTLTLEPSRGETPAPPPDLGIHTTMRALGFRVSRDTRDNHFYPTIGSKAEFTADFFSQSLGGKYSYQSYKIRFDKFWKLRKNQVLAYDLFVCNTAGQPPFYGNCIYGTSSALRGYTAGKYFDRHMAATQAEYRLTLPKGIGLAAFGGLGGVIPGETQIIAKSHFLPAVGGGPRYTVSKKYHVDIAADFAKGVGDWTWGIGIGQAF